MFSHYVDIMLKLPEVAHDLHARLLTAVHICCAQEGRRLAAAWPDWKGTPGEFGFLFRVFGAEVDVHAFLQKVEPMRAKDLIRSFPVLPTPEVASQVCFHRDRRMDSLDGPARIRRLAARAEARGESFVFQPQEHTRKNKHFLRMQSISTGQYFALFVGKRTTASTSNNGGGNYGLGYLLPDF